MRLHAFSALIPLAAAAAGSHAAEPTAFERFATDPDTALVASAAIGSLGSVDSTVEITALVALARADAARRMRGVRFDLRNNGGAEQVYLDEPQLERLLMELDLMELANAADTTERQAAGAAIWVVGTETCWMPNPVQRILCPERVRAPAWSGLRLWTFGGEVFEFRGRDTAELRDLVERAGAALREM
jgi:hypothetical protein